MSSRFNGGSVLTANVVKEDGKGQPMVRNGPLPQPGSSAIAPVARTAQANAEKEKKERWWIWTVFKQKSKVTGAKEYDKMVDLLHDAVTRSGVPAQCECWLYHSVTSRNESELILR